MGRKLILLGKTSLLEQKISVLISLVLVVLILGMFFLKTLAIDALSVGQRTAINTKVADDSLITCTTKAIGGDGSIGNDESVSNCANSHTIHGKEISYCYLVNDNHWSDNDDGHSDEEDDVYDDECRENGREREDV
ncbi:MAG: hypothetical protein Q7J76_04145 [Candidatus Brocadiaceae bacterium]|uniref:hypothetical protein n=1 Tax=Candidatus Wunengus sp. YC61 TaxID=3367698 RepID=UPI0027217D41|nr:hypothetical protein [Candidatus Brocadiaceae bacterium]